MGVSTRVKPVRLIQQVSKYTSLQVNFFSNRNYLAPKYYQDEYYNNPESKSICSHRPGRCEFYKKNDNSDLKYAVSLVFVFKKLKNIE